MVERSRLTHFFLLALLDRADPADRDARRVRTGQRPGSSRSLGSGRPSFCGFLLDRSAHKGGHSRRRSAPRRRRAGCAARCRKACRRSIRRRCRCRAASSPCGPDVARPGRSSPAPSPRKSRRSLDMRLRWKWVSLRWMCGMRLRCLTISTVWARLMPHLVLSLCCFIVPGPCMATPVRSGSGSRSSLRRMPISASLRQALADRVDPLELVHRVDIDAEPFWIAISSSSVCLFEPLSTSVFGLVPAKQRQVHLVDAEAVAAGALLVHDVADGQAVVGLVGEQDLDFGIVAGGRRRGTGGRCSGAGFGDDVERRSEAVGELLDVAVLDPEIAVRPDADEFAEVRLKLAGDKGGAFMLMEPPPSRAGGSDGRLETGMTSPPSAGLEPEGTCGGQLRRSGPG